MGVLIDRSFMSPLAPPQGIPLHNYGCRGTGIRHEGCWSGHIPEMIPELVVPEDLEECPLKPYVPYTCKEINQEEFTSKVIKTQTKIIL